MASRGLPHLESFTRMDLLSKLRVLSVVAPAAFVAGAIAAAVLLADDVPLLPLVIVAVLAVTAATTLFSAMVFQLIERSEASLVEYNSRLAAVHEAATSLSSELGLDVLLQRFVDLSRGITGARYGALAVLASDGSIDEFITSGMAAETRAGIGHPPEGKGLLGVIIHDGETLRLADMGEDPRSGGFPEGHPHMTSLLGVPVISKGSVIGNLYLTDKEEGIFTETDEEMVRTFAANAAVAIENRQMQARMRALAVLQERDRIGMDLHDGIIQSMYAVGLGLEGVLEDVDERPEDARDAIEAAIERLNAVIRDVRGYIFKLQPASASEDLPTSLADLAAEFRVNSLIETSTDVAGDIPELDEERRLALYHVAQEALANARRHAHATTVSLSLAARDGLVRLEVTDNGEGFDPAAAVPEHHRGVRNMMSRAEAVGGKLNIVSTPGSGTTVALDVPAEKRGTDGQHADSHR